MAFMERAMSPSNGTPASSAKTTGRRALSPSRNRLFGRAATFAESSHPLRHRRSSNFSDSIDGARQSIKSSTDDLLLPRARSPDLETSQEPSHWHSIPLALAFLPAIGGLLFEGGSAVVTDVTLLALAVVFLNWAVRLPWNWYISAQSIQREPAQPYIQSRSPNVIVEEGVLDDEKESEPATPSPDGTGSVQKHEEVSESQASSAAAAAELRIHEMLALVACFIGPALGAWLLHYIRSQLSRPSEGLVSNYNLTVFLLASELRPLSHLLKMVQARTLRLQRTVATDPFLKNSPLLSPSTIQDLQTRLTELEAHIADTATNGISSKHASNDLSTQARKAVQPDIDALNRAVRRYEKRATLLTMQTDSRFQGLERRMNDAITLAAAAERTSQSRLQRRGSGLALITNWLTAMVLFPIQIGWSVVGLPGRLTSSILSQIEDYLGKNIKREMKTAGRGESRSGSGSEKRKVQGRGQKKMM